jgi:hypothetical protein
MSDVIRAALSTVRASIAEKPYGLFNDGTSWSNHV